MLLFELHQTYATKAWVVQTSLTETHSKYAQDTMTQGMHTLAHKVRTQRNIIYSYHVLMLTYFLFYSLFFSSCWFDVMTHSLKTLRAEWGNALLRPI